MFISSICGFNDMNRQIDENYIDEGDHCTDKTCNGVMLVSYVAQDPENAVKTWTCNKCNNTESE
ncbi:hypothetical protein M0R04_13365 [Candidatus Dojkabacteria bacterium]|jgi:hypothetical protein|nr:hypothetical protein [Candidatus Dojkabacteria bacterium]